MAQEIESYLLEKLNNGLESSKVPLTKEFKYLIQLLKEKLESGSPSDIPALRANLYFLNDVFIKCQALSGKHTLFSPSLYKIKQDLSKIKADIEIIKAANSIQNGNISLPAQENNAQSDLSDAASSVTLPPQVYGFEDEVMSLEKSLVRQRSSDDSFRAIGIVGIGGVGKSTLCRVLLSQPTVKSFFIPRIWVDMSTRQNEDRDPEIGIIKRILESLGVEEEMMETIFDEYGLGGLICAVHVELMRKRYLIVFDNVQDANNWNSNLNASLPRDVKWKERLAYGLPKGYGGTVIVTSRNEEVLNKMVEEENIHRLLPLSNKDLCWDIFSNEAGEELKKYPLIEELKREVIQKCGGVPLAAKIMGYIMKEKKITQGSAPSPAIETQPSIDSNPVDQ